MSNVYPRQPHRARRGRWNRELYTESVLAESGRRSLTLNEARRAVVLQVLLAEAARLKALSLRAARRRTVWLRRWATLCSPQLASGMAACAIAALTLVVYVLFGGTRIPADATLNGTAAIGERRLGPLGIQWSIAQPGDQLTNYALHRGDTIVAVSPITITYADGSQVVAAPGSRLNMLPGEAGVMLLDGEIASAVTKSASGAPKFRVETTTAAITVKGTQFRVRVGGDGVREYTDEGQVSVTNDVAAIDVSTGEQVHLRNGVKPAAELQVPHVRFETRATDRVISNKTRIPFQARIYPGAALLVTDSDTGSVLSRHTADAQGMVSATLPEVTRAAALQFRQESPDGRVSAMTSPIDVLVDRTPPMLAVTRVVRDANGVRIIGRTEVKAEVRINGERVAVNSDGTFVTKALVDPNAVSTEIVVIDLAGNATTITQSLR